MSPALSGKRQDLLWPVTLHDAAFVCEVHLHLHTTASILATISTVCLKKSPFL